MALAASRVDIVQDGENAVAVKTDVLLDPESGLLLERKTVVAEVLTESGNHKAILVGQQTSVKSVPGARPQYRAIGSRPQTYGTPSYSPAYTPTTSGDNSGAVHCMFCLLTVLFPPILCCWILYCIAKDS